MFWILSNADKTTESWPLCLPPELLEWLLRGRSYGLVVRVEAARGVEGVGKKRSLAGFIVILDV